MRGFSKTNIVVSESIITYPYMYIVRDIIDGYHALHIRAPVVIIINLFRSILMAPQHHMSCSSVRGQS